MPIDSSIALGIRPANVQMQDPMDQFSKGLAIKSLLGKQQMEEAALADDAAVRDAYKNAGGDNTRLRALLHGGGQYKAVQGLDKFDLERQKDQAEIDSKRAGTARSQYDLQQEKVARTSAILSTAKDQPSWDSARRMIIMDSPQAAEHLPPQFDPAFVQQQIARGQTITQALADQRARESSAETGRHNRETATETGRHNRATEGQAAATANRDRRQIVTDTEGNITVVDKDTLVGTPAVDAQGNPLKGRQNMTESQGKAAGMALRAREANGILAKLEGEGVTNRGVIKQAASTVPLVGGALEMGVNTLPRVLGGPSGQQQQVEQARRNFVNAVLRVESGASISEGEFRNAEKQYFPMPGDTDVVKKQKADNRMTAISALEMQSGPQKAKPAAAAPPRKDSIGGVLKQNPDGSFNYGF